ncbi:ATP-binding protein [Ruegeria sp. 2205SS24-7]|uniref:ATP-binding protein n=1 Tax=Ruegeria discodermiae TaxID=3064389 RepID=UPI0027409023|nr:ATP-binding protein [Ruegeria sp. 2205SS24-7]MDP5220836.1 ATP-binding protein [Ruegeria sp. 2205SS24-7]
MNAPRHTEPTLWVEANQANLSVEFARLKACIEDTGAPDPAPAIQPPAAIDRLAMSFGLSDFERDLLLLLAGIALEPALAAAWDAEFGQRSVCFEQAMAVLPDPHWSATVPSRPLRYWRLVMPEIGDALTVAPLHLDERVLHYIAGIDELDAWLRPAVSALAAPRLMAQAHRETVQQAVTFLVAERAEHPIVLLSGDDAEAQEDVAAAIAADLDLAGWSVLSDAIPADPHERDALAIKLDRESVLSGAMFVLDGTCAFTDDLAARLQAPVMIRNGRTHRGTRPALHLRIERPDAPGQRALWNTALGAQALTHQRWIDDIGNRHRLSARQIARVAVHLVHGRASDARHELSVQTALNDNGPSALMRRIDPRAEWSDLILPEAQLRVLEQMSTHLRFQTQVFEEWGFAARSAGGRGIAALFWGGSGTGKSLAAEVIARDQDRDLFRVDLSAVVDKYIGETEKNLRRVFDIGQQTGAVLLFDEADALFGRRSEVKDSHDRYANIGVSYLLSRIEDYTGLAVLTTNHKSALDPAFLRRLRFVVQFPFPDAQERARIWRAVLPQALPQAADIDLQMLARLSVPGGVIRNIALNAAFLAAEAGAPLSMAHLFRAAHLDAMKRDTALSEAETRGWL